MYTFNPSSVPPLVTALFCFFIAAFVYFKSRNSQANIAFSLLGLSCCIWNTGYFFSYLCTDEATAAMWCKFAYCGIAFITPSTYYFSVAFTRQRRQSKAVLLFYAFAVVFVIFIAFTKVIVKGATLHFWGYHTKIGLLHNVFLAFWLTPLFLAFKNLRAGYVNARLPLERQRAKYMFWAVCFGYIGGVDFLAHYGFPVYPFGFAPVILFIFATAYAIVKYRLMEITVLVTRAAIFLFVYALVLGIPLVILALFKNWFILHLGDNWWMGPFGTLIALGTMGPFAYAALERKAESILLREQRRYQEVLKHAAVDLTRIRNVQKLLDHIATTITEAVRISHCAIYTFDAKPQEYTFKASVNVKKKQPLIIKPDSALITWLHIHKESLVYEEVKRRTEESPHSMYGSLEKQMHALHATVIIPCYLENKLLDILILGDKLSGRIYTSEDLTNFSFLANEAALATENASLYGKIEDEVRQRTQELVGVQTQLIQAEKLATVGTLAGGVAHEINNPLTAILTNVQMLLMDSESISRDSKESLELIEEATKRCRTIVQKLMTYSKKPLETTIRAKIDFLDIVNKTTSFLGYQLEQENISIKADFKEGVYTVNGNSNELEQVLTNMILNAKDAIKLKKNSGTITLDLDKDSKWVMLKIADDGVGMTKEIISRIFDPFFTTKDVGKGLGLGLSICQAIIDKHDGSIDVHSVPDQGTVFTVQLPRL